jgi:hypothetical protein
MLIRLSAVVVYWGDTVLKKVVVEIENSKLKRFMPLDAEYSDTLFYRGALLITKNELSSMISFENVKEYIRIGGKSSLNEEVCVYKISPINLLDGSLTSSTTLLRLI